MEKQVAKGVFGSCGGSALGAILGMFIGGWLSIVIFNASHPPQPHNHMHIDLEGVFLALFSLAIGVIVGGILGAMGGGMIGVALATKSNVPPIEQKPPGSIDPPQQTRPEDG